jgi:hypothetical protein
MPAGLPLASSAAPRGVRLDGERLVVCDSGNLRILVSSFVIACPTSPTADTLCWPYGVCGHGGRLAVADSGNNRVMLWQRGGG